MVLGGMLGVGVDFATLAFGVPAFVAAAVLGADCGLIWLATWGGPLSILASRSARALAGSMRPQPNWSSRPFGVSRFALEVSTSRIVAALTVG